MGTGALWGVSPLTHFAAAAARRSRLARFFSGVYHKKYSTINDVNYHFKKFHPKDILAEDRVRFDQEEGRNGCELFNQTFSQIKNFNFHMKEHHGPKNSKQFHCEI